MLGPCNGGFEIPESDFFSESLCRGRHIDCIRKPQESDFLTLKPPKAI